MPKIPPYYADKSELVNAIIEARTVQMETEDTAFAIEWLIEHHHHFSLTSAERALEDQTFRHPALYPEGHPGLEAIRAEQRAKGRRNYQLKKLRPQIIDRDDSRCQNCNARVKGANATLDHKDPEGPSILENLHLLCRKCNTLKGNQSWDEFQKENGKTNSKKSRTRDQTSSASKPAYPSRAGAGKKQDVQTPIYANYPNSVTTVDTQPGPNKWTKPSKKCTQHTTVTVKTTPNPHPERRRIQP